MGMTALPGAIDHVYLTDGKITYTTIGGVEAKTSAAPEFWMWLPFYSMRYAG